MSGGPFQRVINQGPPFRMRPCCVFDANPINVSPKAFTRHGTIRSSLNLWAKRLPYPRLLPVSNHVQVVGCRAAPIRKQFAILHRHTEPMGFELFHVLTITVRLMFCNNRMGNFICRTVCV